MSNPRTIIGDSIPQPDDPTVERTNYTRIVYETEDFKLYAPGESSATFDPTNKGQRIYMWYQFGQIPGIAQPTFVSDAAWKSVTKAPSGFITGNRSLMPKLVIPSELLVDNGLVTDHSTFEAAYQQAGAWPRLFNWDGQEANGANIVPTWPSEWSKYAHVGGVFGSQYVTTRWKKDNVPANSLKLKMVNPVVPPVGEWVGADLVVTGAFVLLLNVVPTTPGTVNPKDVNKNTWSVTIEFGDATLIIGEAGSLKGIISTENRAYGGNLAEGRTKEGPPQQKHIEGKEPFVLGVYPVWNGFIVQSGGQDAAGVVRTSSTVVKKYEKASIFVGYSTGFDPTAPAQVLVGTVSGGDDVTVDFGTDMTVTGENCRFDLAYLPYFFAKKMWFDEWFVGSDSQAGIVTYTYSVYPIWTKNATDYFLNALAVNASAWPGPTANTSYRYVNWQLERLDQTKYIRHAGEVFGSVLGVKEKRDFPVKNGNGNFGITWTGGTPGHDPGGSTDWRDYVQSISVTVDLDGSSGSISVDKYGVAGQQAVADQSIGAVTLDMQGGFGTVGGSVFKGLGMGIADSASAGAAGWTVPLVGQEKKLEDIMLINVPFFDGHTLAEAAEFLSKYAGISYDLSNADGAATLSVSSDVNVPRFDWKAGTSVKQALDMVMEDLHHRYVVRDGKIFFYELDGTTGLPVTTGPDRSGPYPDTKVVSVDRTPVFDNLRNEMVVMSLEAVPQGMGTEIAKVPTFPIFERRSNTTTPDVPWVKSIFRPLSGSLTQAQLSRIADAIASASSTYDILGNVTIPGNADIRPFDKWGDYVIKSVTNAMDMSAKTWTTSMELTKSGR